MSQVLDDIRNVFRRKDDTLTQLIVINIGVFVLLNLIELVQFLAQVEPASGNAFYHLVREQIVLSSEPREFITHPWTIFTYFFAQEQFFHLLSNLIFLFWFGQLIQEYLGSARLLSLYILGGVAGGALYLLAYNTLPALHALSPATLIGSSGSVYAIVVGAATLLPNYTFNLLFIGSVRIVWIALAYVMYSFLSISSSNPGGNIAHLGGAFLGYLFISQLRSGRDLGKPITNTLSWVKGLFQPKSQMRVTYSRPRSFETVSSTPSIRPAKAAQTAPKSPAVIRQEEVDAILDKMLVSGYNSLTLEEKRKLDAAGGDESSNS